MDRADPPRPEDRDRVLDALERAVATGESEITVTYRIEGEREYRVVEESRHYRYGEDGSVAGVIGAFRDVTHQRRSEQRLDALHEASREFVAAETATSVVETVSRAADEILALPINAVYRRDDDLLCPVVYTDRAEAVLGNVPPLERGTAVMWDVYETGEPQVHDDVRNAENVYNSETPVRSELMVPLGEYGVFVAASTTPADFSETDATLTKVLASNAEAALDRIGVSPDDGPGTECIQ